MARRVFEVHWMQLLYDGFVDHHRDLIVGDVFGKMFSPFSPVVDDVFMKTMQGMVWENPQREFHPNPEHKVPAYYAARDLRSGDAKRGSTELIERWDAGEIVDIPGHIVSRNTIRKGCAMFDRTIAVRHCGKIYFEWGGLPGVRFPSTAIALQGGEWTRLESALRTVRDFEKASYQRRVGEFWRFANAVADHLPKEDELFQIWERDHDLGLIRRFFTPRWSAAIKTPDMKLTKGVSYCLVKGRSNDYLLCSMDDAIHHKLLSKQDCSIYDLSEKPT